MSLRFRQLQAFHAIIETGTVTGAAEMLGISQPGVSNLLAQLEQQTRVPLFVREKGRLLPTPEADHLFREVDTVVRGLDHVAQAVSDLQNSQIGQLQLVSQHSISFGFLPPLIAQFAKPRPGLSISFQSQYSPKVQEWVLSGLFEIGICEAPLLQDGLIAHKFQVACRLAIPKGHALAKLRAITPQDLAQVPIIAMGPDHMTHRQMRSAFQDAGLPWQPQIHTHMFRNVLSFVREGMGVSMLDPFALDFDREGGFESRPFEPAVHLDMAVVTSRHRPLSRIGQAFLDLLLQQIAPITVAGIKSD